MTEPEHTDADLVRLTLGDKSFFGYLVERYEEKLRRYLTRLGRMSAEDTEDLLQDIFIKVYLNLNSFDKNLSFSSWIYRIAHNEAMSFWRKRRARVHGHSVDIDEEQLTNFASDSDVFTQIAEKHDAEKLRESLSALPQDQFDAINLRYFEHKSYDEISDILSIPPGTVATRINRAKTKLRSRMSTNGYQHG